MVSILAVFMSHILQNRTFGLLMANCFMAFCNKGKNEMVYFCIFFNGNINKFIYSILFESCLLSYSVSIPHSPSYRDLHFIMKENFPSYTGAKRVQI